VAAGLGLVPAELESSLAVARARVYKARLTRVPPALDDKVLTAWNGLMIGALAEGARVLGDPRYRHAAARAADFLLATLRDGQGRLLRTFRAGTAHLAGYLEDYAYLAEGLLDLYECGGHPRYLDEAAALAGRIVEDFGAEEGGFYSTARDHETLLLRHREGHDGATPSANGTAALVLARLSFHLGRTDLRDQAMGAVRAYGKAIQRHPRAFAKTLSAVDLLLGGPVELAFVGAPADAGLEALRREAGRHSLPNRIVAHHDPAEGATAHPLLAGKTLVEGRAALYVCRDFACRRPVTQPGEVAAVLASALADAQATRAPATARLPGSAAAAVQVSRLGFGGYRVDDETPVQREALRLALRRGVNVLDTSTNYTDGGSERLFGEVLAEGARDGWLAREAAVVVSKIGYVQGENLELAREREAEGRPFPEVVKYAEGVWHCIHPEFLADQLDRSLARLQLETLDVCLLHNPEYYLSDAHERSHGTVDRRRTEFYRRLKDAFAYLESQVAAGRIRAYGVSSNTCVRPAADPEATSLTRMLEAAGPAFRWLQLPLNLLEPGAVLERNTGPGGSLTVLEAARTAGLTVLANRPLNAMTGDGMLRLVDVAAEAAAVDLAEQTRLVDELEDEYRREIAAHLEGPEGGLPPADFFRWGAELSGVVAHLKGREHWEAIEAQRVLPRLAGSLQALDHGLTGPLAETWRTWRGRYVPALQSLLRELRRRAASRTREQLEALRAALDPLLPPERREEPLARKALWVVASTPGVNTALVGMRTPRYVEDALAVLAWPPLAHAEEVYAALKGVAAEP
jgi:aryl-alcohol dehydrogenase-like predicted oxidoreductase